MGVTASNADQQLLLGLQEVDTRIVRITAKLAKLPQTARIDELDRELAELDRAVLEKLGAHDDVTTEVTRIEQDVSTVTARLTRDRDRLPSITDAKTAAATEHEIATLERRQSELEDLQLEAMERQEAAASALESARSEAATARDERERLAGEREAESAGLTYDIEAARAERTALAGPIPADLLALYDRQRERYGIGATLLRRRTSDASGVELTSAELLEVQQAAEDAVILDPNSSAILVRTSDTSVE